MIRHIQHVRLRQTTRAVSPLDRFPILRFEAIALLIQLAEESTPGVVAELAVVCFALRSLKD
jgi:hypothetical protein